MTDAITCDKLGIPKTELNTIIEKLQLADMITGANIFYADNIPYVVFLENVRITAKGIQYVEKSLGLTVRDTRENRLKGVKSAVQEFTENVLSKALAEYMKSKM